MYCTACGAAVASTPERLQAALGSDYQIMGELGRGGFAIVYSVRDLKLRRYLAVKVMRHELMTSRVVVERFRREARYVAELDHPNILSVAFSGEQASLVYYAMPRVRGKALSKILETEKSVPLPETLLSASGTSLSLSGEIIGTPEYMSPELPVAPGRGCRAFACARAAKGVRPASSSYPTTPLVDRPSRSSTNNFGKSRTA